MIEIKKTNKYWDSLDFFLNRAYWSHIGTEKSIEIRIDNLKAISAIFSEEQVTVFLEGRTLEGIVLNSRLLEEDHDDDVGMFSEDVNVLMGRIIANKPYIPFRAKVIY